MREAVKSESANCLVPAAEVKIGRLVLQPRRMMRRIGGQMLGCEYLQELKQKYFFDLQSLMHRSGL